MNQNQKIINILEYCYVIIGNSYWLFKTGSIELFVQLKNSTRDKEKENDENPFFSIENDSIEIKNTFVDKICKYAKEKWLEKKNLTNLVHTMAILMFLCEINKFIMTRCFVDNKQHW